MPVPIIDGGTGRVLADRLHSAEYDCRESRPVCRTRRGNRVPPHCARLPLAKRLPFDVIGTMKVMKAMKTSGERLRARRQNRFVFSLFMFFMVDPALTQTLLARDGGTKP
jgi:hypothetical protein